MILEPTLSVLEHACARSVPLSERVPLIGVADPRVVEMAASSSGIVEKDSISFAVLYREDIEVRITFE